MHKNDFRPLDAGESTLQKKQNFKKCHVNRKAWACTMDVVKKNILKNKYYNKNDLIKACNIAKNIIRARSFEGYSFFRYENQKVKNTLIFDLPAAVTCRGVCTGCYALKAERMYSNTRIMRLYHYIIMVYCQHDIDFKTWLVDYITDFLKNHNKLGYTIVRLHASGDFFNSEYLNFWLAIAKNTTNYNIVFYTYSKQLNNGMIDAINTYHSNFNIIKSIINIDNKHFINFGSKEYIQNISNKLKEAGKSFHVCDYGANSAHVCMGNCHACLYNDIVLFNKH